MRLGLLNSLAATSYSERLFGVALRMTRDFSREGATMTPSKRLDDSVDSTVAIWRRPLRASGDCAAYSYCLP